MNIWNKSKAYDMGKIILVWRNRALNRFFMKIGTWLLGGFVCGMLASIFFAMIGLPDLSVAIARTVFFIVFITGVIDAFFRNVYYGVEYRITENALVYIKPLFGLEAVGNYFGTDEQPFGQKFEYIPWNDIKEIKDQEGNLFVLLKDNKGTVILDVSPVINIFSKEKSYVLKDQNEKKSLFTKDPKFDREALRTILQTTRDVKKSFITS